MDQTAIDASMATLENAERLLSAAGLSIDADGGPGWEAALSDHLADGGAPAVLALARYCLSGGMQARAIRLMAYLLPLGVLPSMLDRLKALYGEEAAQRVARSVSIPRDGSPPEAYPAATRDFTEAALAELGPQKLHELLAWNVHGIPEDGHLKERAVLERLGSLDAWLADYHARQVAILEGHAKDGTLWYEQRITGEVVDFVRSNQEILSGVRHGSIIYQTKIPYDPDRYLRTDNRLEKRHLACHCPLAASAITESGSGVPAPWCSCSAGYEKFRFDTVFGVETKATVVNSVLAGDTICRYAVQVPPQIMERFAR